MNILRRHGKLLCFVCLMLLGIMGTLSGSVEESMLALVPRYIKKPIFLFEHSPLSQKLIVITQAASVEQARETATTLQNALAQAGFITPKAPFSENIVLDLLSALPQLFSPKFQAGTEQKISSREVTKQFDRYYEELFSFQSVLATQRITQDPFYLTEIIFDSWAKIGKSVQPLNYTEGFLSNDDGKIWVGLYDMKAAISDIAAARQLQRFFATFQSSLPQEVRVFFMGGARYTLENALLIKKDLTVVTWVGVICLLLVFVGFFRNKRAIWVYLLPLLVLPPAAWGTQLIFGRISGITLGFGSVVVGLTVDYAIYIYFALQQTKMETSVVVSKITKHLWCNFLTSGLCFVALLFSSIEVFKQIAVFALIALSLAFFIAVYVLPRYFKSSVVNPPMVSAWLIRPLPFKWAVGVSIFLLGFGFWGVQHLSLNTNLESLNSTSRAFVRDKQIADKLFPSNQGALLFALGNSREEALKHNEQLATQIPEGLPVSEIFVSEQMQTQNLNRWKKFWNESRQNNAQHLLHEQARKKGFNVQSFSPFLTWLRTETVQPNFDFSTWYNPVISIEDKTYAVVNIVPNESAYANLADGVHAVFISVAQLQADLVQSVKKEALWVVGLALMLNMITMWILFRNLKETVLCFIPVLLGGCFLFGCLSLLHISVNLFGLIFLPLLIGLGLDYAIFQLMKYRSNRDDEQLYSAQALLAAGLSTLAGFGVLVFAKHAVLFMMGICALIGIIGTVLVSLLILPSLWKHSV